MATHTGTHTDSAAPESDYAPERLERYWQEAWEQSGVFATPKLAPGERGSYIMPVPPSPLETRTWDTSAATR